MLTVHELSLPALFLAGLATSPHCGLMCGPLQALQLRGAAPSGRILLWLHLGRVLGYGVLGAFAGGIGAQLLARLPNVQFGTAVQVLAAGVLILLGLSYLRQTAPRCCAAQNSPHPPSQPSRSQALRRGLAWALMPCGALYAMLFLAAASGGVLSGALLMAAFGLGTVPLLAAGGTALARVLRPGRLRTAAATALVVFGLSSLAILLHQADDGSTWCRPVANATLSRS